MSWTHARTNSYKYADDMTLILTMVHQSRPELWCFTLVSYSTLIDTDFDCGSDSPGRYGIFFVEWIFCWMNHHGFFLNEYFVEWIIWLFFWMNILLNEYFRFKFWMNIELNRFWPRFNIWMNFQNVSHRAILSSLRNLFET